MVILLSSCHFYTTKANEDRPEINANSCSSSQQRSSFSGMGGGYFWNGAHRHEQQTAVYFLIINQLTKTKTIKNYEKAHRNFPRNCNSQF